MKRSCGTHAAKKPWFARPWTTPIQVHPQPNYRYTLHTDRQILVIPSSTAHYTVHPQLNYQYTLLADIPNLTTDTHLLPLIQSTLSAATLSTHGTVHPLTKPHTVYTEHPQLSYTLYMGNPQLNCTLTQSASIHSQLNYALSTLHSYTNTSTTTTQLLSILHFAPAEFKFAPQVDLIPSRLEKAESQNPNFYLPSPHAQFMWA